MSDDEQRGAPGPIAVDKHTSETPVGREGTVDPRAAFLQQEREVQNQLGSAIPDPTASILLAEIQDMRARLDTFSVAALSAIWLTGMMIGYAGYVYFKNNPIPVHVESDSEGDSDGE